MPQVVNIEFMTMRSEPILGKQRVEEMRRAINRLANVEARRGRTVTSVEVKHNNVPFYITVDVFVDDEIDLGWSLRKELSGDLDTIPKVCDALLDALLNLGLDRRPAALLLCLLCLLFLF